MSESVVERVVSVRNAVNSGTAACGGTCLVNSHGNSVRQSVFAGNGSVANNNDDFGLGLIVGSSGNLIENNTIGGNTNGILIHADSANNTIRRNIVAGNPPSQISRDYGGAIGADVRDESTAEGSGNRNSFQENWCVTYSGPGPAPCPSLATQPLVTPAACTTQKPATDWLCVNGGWVPPGHPLAGPTPSPNGCTGPDPFAGIPGLVGECVSGGWVPRVVGGGGD